MANNASSVRRDTPGLANEDLSFTVPIESSSLLTRNDLRAALDAGAVYSVRVAERSENQMLFINVPVAAE